MQLLLHARNGIVPSKLDTRHSGLCEVTEMRGVLLSPGKFDTQRIFIANHNSFRRSTIARNGIIQVAAARAAPLLQILHSAPPLTAQAFQQLTLHAVSTVLVP